MEARREAGARGAAYAVKGGATGGAERGRTGGAWRGGAELGLLLPDGVGAAVEGGEEQEGSEEGAGRHGITGMGVVETATVAAIVTISTSPKMMPTAGSRSASEAASVRMAK